MLWFASACALALTMSALHHYTAAGALAARATLALGFLVIAAWLGGELAARRRVPRVTGFLLVGLCVGPAWLNLVRADELAALQFLADAGVALFALVAGSELAGAARAPDRIGLARVAGVAIGLPFAAVTLVMLTVSPWFPLTVHESFGNAVGVALVLGALAAVASPVLSVITAEDTPVTGPLARAVIGVTALQDVALLLVLSLVLLVAQPLARPGALNFAVAGGALLRWAGSLAAGGVLGILVVQAGVFSDGGAKRGTGTTLDTGVTPLVLTLGCLLALLGRALDVEPLLVALAAGFTSKQRGLDLGATVGRVLQGGGGGGGRSQPITAACFGIVGAGLRFDALADLWPWVVLLVCLRAAALRHGVRWVAERAGAGVTPALAPEGWLGLISQSGTALGLGPLVRRAFPALGVSLEALILATVAVHEVVGPVCFRQALTRGSRKEAANVGEGADAVGAIVGVTGSGVR